MHFEKGQLYHIFNQGNNKQMIFFNRDNYLFFLKKVKACFEPYADILAWCLMPNHFHFMVLVNEIGRTYSGGATSSRTPTEHAGLNKDIGVLLASYTRAINNQNGTSGSLFRKQTKAECLSFSNGVTPAFIDTLQGTLINNTPSEKQYPQLCFNYIHQNPVKAGLTRKAEEWEFSSASDYANLREGTLVNKAKAKEYVTF